MNPRTPVRVERSFNFDVEDRRLKSYVAHPISKSIAIIIIDLEYFINNNIFCVHVEIISRKTNRESHIKEYKFDSCIDAMVCYEGWKEMVKRRDKSII